MNTSVNWIGLLTALWVGLLIAGLCVVGELLDGHGFSPARWFAGGQRKDASAS